MAPNTLDIITSVIFQTYSYLSVPILLAFAFTKKSAWLSLAGIVSTILISTINSHLEHPDVHNILVQFFFWLAEWAMLFWFQSTLPFEFEDLPAALRPVIIIISIIFLEIVFHRLVRSARGDLGTFGKFHMVISKWARFTWSEVRQGWDIVGAFAIRGTEDLTRCLEIAGAYVVHGGKVITDLLVRLCRICGVRDGQGEGPDEAEDGLELEVQAQASTPPAYSYYAIIDSSHSQPDNKSLKPSQN